MLYNSSITSVSSLTQDKQVKPEQNIDIRWFHITLTVSDNALQLIISWILECELNTDKVGLKLDQI